MRKFLPLLLCLSLSIFTVARATKLTATTTHQADAKTFSPYADSAQEQGSDNDQNADGTANDDDENASDADDDDAAGGQDPGNDDGTNDNGADDDPGDGDDDGGGK